MRALTVSAIMIVLSGLAWTTHLPSPNPVNGSFIVLCASIGMFIRALYTQEQHRV